jgi:hypothetical protein
MARQSLAGFARQRAVRGHAPFTTDGRPPPGGGPSWHPLDRLLRAWLLERRDGARGAARAAAATAATPTPPSACRRPAGAADAREWCGLADALQRTWEALQRSECGRPGVNDGDGTGEGRSGLGRRRANPSPL